MALTVTMTRDVIYNGATLTSGASPTLPDDVARQLVYERRAVMVSPDVQPSRTSVLWADATGTTVVKPDGSTAQFGGGVGGTYTLPVATASTLGGVKQGSGVTIAADGTLSVPGGGGYTLPPASTTTLGGVKLGWDMAADANGVLTLAPGEVQVTAVENNSASHYVVPNGTRAVVLQNTGTIYNWYLDLPSVPYDGQVLTVASPAGIVQRVRLASLSGAAVPADFALYQGDDVLLRYSATGNKWVAYSLSVRAIPSNSTGYFRLCSYGGLGWQMNQPSASVDIMFGSGSVYYQATNANSLGRSPTAGFRVDGTTDVTTTNGSDYAYSTTGFWAGVADASVPFGAGVTADRTIAFGLLGTCRQYAAGQMWPGSPAGSGVWLYTKYVPIYIGDKLNGLYAQWDALGNFRTMKMSVDESAQTSTDTAGTVQMANNTSRLIMRGSGSVTVLTPTAPVNGQPMRLCVRNSYTAITVSATAGQTLVAGAAVGVTAGSTAAWQYDASTTTWDRIA